jgi:hypothetical protein
VLPEAGSLKSHIDPHQSERVDLPFADRSVRAEMTQFRLARPSPRDGINVGHRNGEVPPVDKLVHGSCGDPLRSTFSINPMRKARVSQSVEFCFEIMVHASHHCSGVFYQNVRVTRVTIVRETDTSAVDNKRFRARWVTDAPNK